MLKMHSGNKGNERYHAKGRQCIQLKGIVYVYPTAKEQHVQETKEASKDVGRFDLPS